MPGAPHAGIGGAHPHRGTAVANFGIGGHPHWCTEDRFRDSTMDESTGKVALVTGSSRGIGRSIALELADAGYDLMLTARDAATLQSVADEIRALGRKAAIHAADLTASAAPAA